MSIGEILWVFALSAKDTLLWWLLVLLLLKVLMDAIDIAHVKGLVIVLLWLFLILSFLWLL